MGTKIVCYKLGNISPIHRTNLHRKLYGYTDNSNHGKYKYHRKGFLEGVKHKKVLDCVIIVSNENSIDLVKILRKYNAKISVFDVLVNFKL
jgi:hypothetical protein